ncbi:MAG: hypothetical protein GX786_05615 [Clostridiales bacterium]|nr:hypothetical protein [Clostridiales bacterium]
MSQNKKKKQKPVQKPIHKGKVLEKNVFKRALKVWGTLVLLTVLYLVFGPMFMFENVFLRIVLNTALLLLGAGILMMSGISDGESDAALGEIVYQRKLTGKPVSQQEEASSYRPGKGFATALFGVSPFFLLAVVLAFTTKENTYSLGVLPAWIQSYKDVTMTGKALEYYDITRSLGAVDIIRTIVRAHLLPIFSMINIQAASEVLIERLTPLLVLILPMGYGIGYLRGKQVRSMIHSNIAKNTRKKRKQDKRARPKKTPKEPEKLV